MSKPVIHLSRHSPNAYGGYTAGSICRRLAVTEDGMNVTKDRAAVTCKLCLKEMRREAAQ